MSKRVAGDREQRQHEHEWPASNREVPEEERALHLKSTPAAPPGLCFRYATIATSRCVLLPQVRFHQRDVLGHRIPVLPRGEVLRDESGDLLVLLA